MNGGGETWAMTVHVERQWLTYREAQELAGLGRTKLWQLVTAGDVPAAKIGRSVRISRDGLQQYMKRNCYGVADR
jgi:excisionase family DNA binding protein